MKLMIYLLAGLFLMCVTALPVGAQQEGKKEENKTDTAVPTVPERPKSLEEAVKKADLIFVGLVDFVGDKPDNWGDPPYHPISQFVRYEVLKFLKGQHPAKKITVLHELLKGSKTAADRPGLNPKMFDIDKKVILLLSNDLVEDNPVTFLCLDPDFGAMPWTEDDEKKISAMIK